MGKIACANAAGDNLKFKDFISAVIFRAMNTKMFNWGTCDEDMINITYENSKAYTYKKLYFETNILVGTTLLGYIFESGKLVEQIKNNTSMNEVLK